MPRVAPSGMDDTPNPKDIPPQVKRGRDQVNVDIDEGHPREDSGPDASEAPKEKGSASPH